MIIENLKNASNSIDFFASDNYVASDEPVEIPRCVDIPKRI